ncbi:MAG TPA: hypothetical protein VFG86_13800, partial [Chloroflexota bacterium]|nr:hypothetical protein [Chloroflexota bacterium]
CFNRELQVALVLAATLLMLRVFDSPRWRDESGTTGIFLGLAVLVFRVVLFGLFEQRFDFTSVEVTAGSMGAKQLDLGFTIFVICLKYATPFLLVLALATRRLSAVGFRRVCLVVLALMAMRILQIIALVMLTMDQFHAVWHLLGELSFYVGFIASFCLTAGIYALARAGGLTLSWPATELASDDEPATVTAEPA